jgi:GNAT superfamily N-acetyltransferase
MDAMKIGWRRQGEARLFLRKSTAFPKDLSRHVLEVRGVETPLEHQRQGLATMLLQSVCAEADRTGTVLVLWPAPWGVNESMTQQQLIDWYAKFGFESIQPNPVLMARPLQVPNLKLNPTLEAIYVHAQ